MEERLQKLIAAAGVASRRHAEELITAGRVTVNGQVVRSWAPKPILKKTTSKSTASSSILSSSRAKKFTYC